MGNTLNIAGNRLSNTVAIAPRTAGTVVTAAADLFTTLKTVPKESLEIAAKTSQEVKNILIGTWTEKTKPIKKAIKIAVSPVVASASIIEGGARLIVQPIYNGIVNTKNTVVNTLKNTRRSTFGRVLSKKPLSDFSYDNLSTRNLNLKSSTSSWWLNGAKSSEKEEGENKTSRWQKRKEKRKNEETKTKEIKKETKSETKVIDTSKTSDKKEEVETVNEEKEENNVQKTKDILLNSQHGNEIYNKFREKLPGLKMIYDKNSSHGEIKKGDQEGYADIIIGEKMPKDKYQIAPMNESKDIEYQKRHLIAHELSHLIINDQSGDKHLDGLLNMSKKYYNKNKQTLTPLAQMKMYKSDGDKSKEDIVEMLAMSSLNANIFNKYLLKLTSDKKEDIAYRKEFNLARITDTDKDTIKTVCASIIKKYSDNTSSNNKFKTDKLATDKIKEKYINPDNSKTNAA